MLGQGRNSAPHVRTVNLQRLWSGHSGGNRRKSLLPDARIDGHVLRPEIQALRALAVTLVVTYHLWPTTLRGGYVGVDMFFVISGFLITSHIVRGIQSDAGFSLPSFYVRRVRRLLPASLLVLTVSCGVSLLFIPQTLWEVIGRQVIASGLYVQNWLLAGAAVDYLAVSSDASPVQHFWSLSVEEQFYLVWPALLVATAAIAGRRNLRVRALVVVVSLATAASLIYSVYLTTTAPSLAYFVTPTRVWEFGIGGLCAFVAVRSGVPTWLRACLSWLGLLLVLGAAWFFDANTPFPGMAALFPVLGTAAVILAGDARASWAPSAIANLRPVQFIGGISYSLYLWHWPLIVLLPYMLLGAGEMTRVEKVAVVVASVMLGWMSKVFVEDRFRGVGANSKTNRRPFRKPLIAAVAGMAVVSCLGGVAVFTAEQRKADAELELSTFATADLACFGAASLEEPRNGECARDLSSQRIVPDPIIATDDVFAKSCQQTLDDSEALSCRFGSALEGAPRIVLVGDSHANQWAATLDGIAQKTGWRIIVYSKSACPFTQSEFVSSSCGEWNDNVARELSRIDIKLIVTSAANRTDIYSGVEAGKYSRAVSGFEEAWAPSVARGIPIVAIADTPRPGNTKVTSPSECVEMGSVSCGFSRKSALRVDPLFNAAQGTQGLTPVDMSEFFCGERRCESVIGRVLVYRDDNHMTAAYARTLVESLREKLGPLVDLVG